MMSLLRRYFANDWFVGSLIALLVAMISVSVGRNMALLELAENYLSDVRLAMMSPPRPQSSRIAVVVINDETLLDYPYRSPLDRSLIATLIDELERRKVAAIGINILFDRPTEADKDQMLYQRLRSSGVPIVLSRISGSVGYSLAQIEFSKYFLKDLRSGLSFIYRDTVDDTIRNSLLKMIQGRTVNLGFAATLAEVLGVELPEREKLLIDFRPGPDLSTSPFPVYAAHQLAELPESALANRVVLIGSYFGDDSGLRTPLSVLDSAIDRNLSGVEIEAHVLSQLIEGRSLVATTSQQNFLITLAMAALGCLLAMVSIRIWVKILISVLFVPVTWVGAFAIFMGQALIMPMVIPTLAFAGALIIGSFWQWRSEFQRRERVHNAFGRFLAPAIVEQILANADQLEMSGEVREVSFLFTDLEGFTRLTESNSPQAMVGLVNAYLEQACDIAIEHGGIIDKIIGDALHVMFNAPLLQPDHAQRAIECALALDKWSQAFRLRMHKQGIDLGITRIGVNTGECIVGNFGGKRRFDYTAHGDVVNVTARLEAVNKRLGTRICVSEATVSQCHGIHFRPVANLVLPGKTRGITTFMPVAADGFDSDLHQQYSEAYDLLGQGDPQALQAFAEIAATNPDDTLVNLHHQRCQSNELNTTLVIREK